MKPQVLLLLLLLAAGAVAWFAFAGGDPVAPVAPGQSAQAPSHLAEPAAPAAVGSPAVAPGGAAAQDAGGSRSAAPDLAPTGGADATVTVRGRLVDLAGAPRAGVVMEVTTWGSFGDGDLEFVAASPLPTDRNRPTLETTTRGDGVFELRVPADRGGSFELTADDLVFASKEPQFRPRRGDQDLGEFVVVRSGSVSGVVQDERGQPVADVSVAMQFGPLGFGSQSSTRSAADGSFTIGKLRPGEWTLRTASGKFLPAAEQLRIEAEEQRQGVVIVLREGQAVAGRVVDERGVGVAGFKVGSRRREMRGAVDVQRFSADEATTTDELGRFTLSGLEGDAVTVRAFGPGHTTVTVADVQVGTGNLELRVQRYGTIEGVLVATDGTAIVGSRVEVRAGAAIDGPELFVPDDLPMADGRRVVKTDERGRFTLESVRPGVVSVHAHGDGHLPARLEGVRVLPAQATRDVRIVADAGAIARIQVLDDEGEPVADATVRVKRSGPGGSDGVYIAARSVAVDDMEGDVRIAGGAEDLGTARTDADGRAVVTGLPPGEAVVDATHGEFAPSLPVAIVLPATGAAEGVVRLQKPGFVEVLVTRADGSAAADTNVLLRKVGEQEGPELVLGGFVGGGGHEAVADAEGRARFGPLAGGSYTALLSRKPEASNVGGMMIVLGSGGGELDSTATPVVVVPGQTSKVSLRMPVLARLHGRVLGAEGPVPGAVVELGEDGGSVEMPGMGGRTAKADADGHFEFADVEPGHYVLSYGKADQVVKAELPVDVPAGSPEVLQDLPLRTGTVRVRLVGKGDGAPVREAQVFLERGRSDAGGERPRQVMMFAVATIGDGGESSTMTFGTQRAVTDGDGVAIVEDVPVGEYSLRIEHDLFAPGKKGGVVVVERQTTDAGVVELAPAAEIRGDVVDAAGQPAAMALVQCRSKGEEDWSQREVAQGGGFRLRGLEPGTYELCARALGGGPAQSGPILEVEVGPGATERVQLRLSR